MEILLYLTFALFCWPIVTCNDEQSLEPGAEGFLKREHTLVRPFQGTVLVYAELWDFTGSTIVTGTHIRLTPDHQSKAGAIWNRIPCMLRNWEVLIHFKVHGNGVDLYGDGFAFWLTKGRNEMGKVFGSKDPFSGLAIFFDTYSNQNGEHAHVHPYVSAVVNNGSMSYDHDYDGTHIQIAGCSAPFRGREHDTFASIRFVNNRLTAKLDIDGNGEWRQCFDADEVFLPLGYFFGISAATGDLADNHDILTFKVFELPADETSDISDTALLNLVPHAKTAEAPRDKPVGVFQRKSMSTIFMFLILLIVCGGIVFFLVKRQQTNAKKRFY
ncbi:uncharacterized protein TRIADDRAFT_28425 [Trichoplax adhaerens]|uniref:L-type lectin-like domain-containing protein n=1 Tax=Trichoplax adhaerens TaxID=10228 RepID=B3S302_TRIAD|nr:hypothetical protein TRIADDRAFT_28425 [Trichoplax adhaerens]EDV22881.1 hypothetical protein TRIADDRAFT_28425 [Trichoplax adhaerens]|eukprot:XP_002114747.1 hypothetical protein TRIADDRAFT_28425 [Trichoplax adhaerens]